MDNFLIDEIIENIDKKPFGFCTGIKALDDITRGFFKGQFFVIGSRPGVGKTAFMLDCVLNISKKHKTGIFSYEMPAVHLVERMVCNLAKVNYYKVGRGLYHQKIKEKLRRAGLLLKSRNWWIDDSPPPFYPLDYKQRYKKSIPKFSLNKRIAKAAIEGTKIVFIDYLQLIPIEGWFESEPLRIKAITNGLFKLAKKYDIAVVLLSQLKRFESDEHRQDFRPRISDLKWGGSIEQDAWVIILLFRPEKYETEQKDLLSNHIEESAEIIVAKNRNGPEGTVYVNFHSYAMSFRGKEDGF